MPRSFALGAHFEALIDDLVKGGRYNYGSELVRAGLRLLEDPEAERQRTIEVSRREGRCIPADAVLDGLEAKHAAMAAAEEEARSRD